MELTRFLERHKTIGGVCCRGQEPERILSLPMGERPEAACEGTLKPGYLPCQGDASTQNSGYRRAPRGSEVTLTQSRDDMKPILRHGSTRCRPSHSANKASVIGWPSCQRVPETSNRGRPDRKAAVHHGARIDSGRRPDRKSTRLNSSHLGI